VSLLLRERDHYQFLYSNSNVVICRWRRWRHLCRGVGEYRRRKIRKTRCGTSSTGVQGACCWTCSVLLNTSKTTRCWWVFHCY